MVSRIELGSEFNLNFNELSLTENNLINFLSTYSTLWLDSGRSAIKCIETLSDKIVLLPEYICESVISCFNIHNVKFYKINEDFTIDVDDLFSKINRNIGAIFIVNYFGCIHNENILLKIRDIADFLGITVVEDNTQSLFSKHNSIGDYQVASVRKWLPCPNGGVLYSSKNNLKVDGTKFYRSKHNDKVKAMLLKDMYLKDNLDVNEVYRQIFVNAEEKFSQDSIYKISDLSRFIINCFDVDKLVSKRKRNYQHLKEGLKTLGINVTHTLSEKECPFVLPLRVKNRNDFREFLIDNRIYCAVHWPFDGPDAENRSIAKYNADTLISLPVDQRYSESDIDYMLEVISRYRGRLLF